MTTTAAVGSPRERHRNSLDRFLEELLRETSVSSLDTSIVQDNPSVLMESSSRSMRVMARTSSWNALTMSSSSSSSRRRRTRRAHSTGSRRRRTSSRSLTKAISRWESYPFSSATTSAAAAAAVPASTAMDGSSNTSISELPPLPQRRLSDDDETMKLDEKLKQELAQIDQVQEDNNMSLAYPSAATPAGLMTVNGRDHHVIEANQPLDPHHLPPPPPRDEMIHVPASRTYLHSTMDHHPSHKINHSSKHSSSPKMPRRRYDTTEEEEQQNSVAVKQEFPTTPKKGNDNTDNKRKHSSRQKHRRRHHNNNNKKSHKAASLSPERAPRFPKRTHEQDDDNDFAATTTTTNDTPRQFNVMRSCSDPAIMDGDSNVVSVKHALTLMNATLPRRQVSPYHGRKMKVILSQAKQTMLLQDDANNLMMLENDDDVNVNHNNNQGKDDIRIDASAADNLPIYL
ncbi:expressed unknown protein [Seminavis robusta]|uniref:Uncharacterized protein n=1 Tax=Seminavis robusta TaxID=568900 RepID=A0A9N8H665_9STRA|nr:expressed unknown protein [Seminavis robusta]|eukprot:Sro104_g052700.1 n/a (456) ;mRNA; r:23620-24987